MIDSATELGLEEIEAIRETVDTGEMGEFMPQLRALVAVNPGSEHFPVVRVNGITSAMTFPRGGRRWRRRAGRRRADDLRPGGADPHRRLDLGRNGGLPSAAMRCISGLGGPRRPGRRPDSGAFGNDPARPAPAMRRPAQLSAADRQAHRFLRQARADTRKPKRPTSPDSGAT